MNTFTNKKFRWEIIIESIIFQKEQERADRKECNEYHQYKKEDRINAGPGQLRVIGH